MAVHLPLSHPCSYAYICKQRSLNKRLNHEAIAHVHAGTPSSAPSLPLPLSICMLWERLVPQSSSGVPMDLETLQQHLV